jgi:hypothetical protein
MLGCPCLCLVYFPSTLGISLAIRRKHFLCQEYHLAWHTKHKLLDGCLQSNQEVHMLSHQSPIIPRQFIMILYNLYWMNAVGFDEQ